MSFKSMANPVMLVVSSIQIRSKKKKAMIDTLHFLVVGSLDINLENENTNLG